MAQVFRRRVIALFLQRKFIDRSRAASLLAWHHSGFSLDSVGLYAHDQKAMERLAQYMARPPIALSKVVLEEQGGNVGGMCCVSSATKSVTANSFRLSPKYGLYLV